MLKHVFCMCMFDYYVLVIVILMIHLTAWPVLLSSGPSIKTSFNGRRTTPSTPSCRFIFYTHLQSLNVSSNSLWICCRRLTFVFLLLFLRLLECGDCGRKMHQICVLHNETIWPSGWAHYFDLSKQKQWSQQAVSASEALLEDFYFKFFIFVLC